MKGNMEKTLLNCRYLSDLRWQIAKTVQVIVEMAVQKHLKPNWLEACVMGLRVTAACQWFPEHLSQRGRLKFLQGSVSIHCP